VNAGPLGRARRLVGLLLCAAAAACVLPQPASAEVIWGADMETGNLSQWERGRSALPGASWDTGDCRRPRSGVSREVAHSGRFSMKLTINASRGTAACRQYRYEEAQTGWPLFYSAWFYLPNHYVIDDFWNLMQFKSQRFDDVRGVFWVVDLDNRRTGRKNLFLKLRWKGDAFGPHAGSRSRARQVYTQNRVDVPVRRWFHIEIYLRQAEGFDGRITVWQDGVRIYDVDGIRTRWPRGDQRMSINAYSDGLAPQTATVFVDDAVISTTRAYGRSRAASAGARPPASDRSGKGSPAGGSASTPASASQPDARDTSAAGVAIAGAALLLALALIAAFAPSERLRRHRSEIIAIGGVAALTALVIAALSG
jgi:Polysaccharide lyase